MIIGRYSKNVKQLNALFSLNLICIVAKFFSNGNDVSDKSLYTSTVGRKMIRTLPQDFFFPLVLYYKELHKSFYQLDIMPSLYTVIFGFGYLSISVLLKREEKNINILHLCKIT